MKLTTEQKRELEQLVASGEKIAAIKQVRDIADVGLAEAKAFIESLERADPGAHGVEPGNLRQAEEAALAAIRDGDMAAAIRAYRQHTQIGLEEAKDAIDPLLVVDRTEGRVSAKLAKAVFDLIRTGERDAAITLLTTQSGLDEPEARRLLRAMSGNGLRGAVMKGGWSLTVFGVVALAVFAWVILNAVSAS